VESGSAEEETVNDIQILTVAISLVLPVTAILYSNKRLDDMFSMSNKRLDDLEKRMIERLDNGFEHMELLLKLHEAEHHKK
jgi:hypothetical protein